MWPKPEEGFGTLLNRHMKRKGMDSEQLAQELQALGYPREMVHPGRMMLATSDSDAHRWRNTPQILKGIEQVLDLDSEEISELTNAYLYHPPDPPRGRRRQ
jgi:hypothetical protein